MPCPTFHALNCPLLEWFIGPLQGKMWLLIRTCIRPPKMGYSMAPNGLSRKQANLRRKKQESVYVCMQKKGGGGRGRERQGGRREREIEIMGGLGRG